MPSPFPGMDPYLERPGIFPDLHDSLIVFLRDSINEQLPEPYFAAISSRVWIEDTRRRIEPDVNVLRPQTNGPGAGRCVGGGPARDILQNRRFYSRFRTRCRHRGHGMSIACK